MPMRSLSVMQAKRFGVWTIDPEADLKSVARQMQDHNVSALVVVDSGGYLQGVITRTDLVRACYQDRSWGHRQARDFMATDVVTVRLDDKLEHVMELLINNHIHRVVAVEEQNGRSKPVAVLSAADIVYHMAQEKRTSVPG